MIEVLVSRLFAGTQSSRSNDWLNWDTRSQQTLLLFHDPFAILKAKEAPVSLVLVGL